MHKTELLQASYRDQQLLGSAPGKTSGDNSNHRQEVAAGLHLTRALADARKDRETTVALGDVVDQLHDKHGLADARTAEQTDLATTLVWRQQVHDLAQSRIMLMHTFQLTDS
jgi:hypothetical protein